MNVTLCCMLVARHRYGGSTRRDQRPVSHDCRLLVSSMPVPPYVALLSMAAHLHVYHCRETKIEAAFELWDETAQDDHRLAGRKERSHDDLMNQKRTLLMLLTGVTHRCYSQVLLTGGHTMYRHISSVTRIIPKCQ